MSTTTPSRRFSLQFANACLAKILPWLSPYAERIEVAGSIRRKCESIGDIDLVVIPKTVPISDLFGNPTGQRNKVAEEIRKTCLERGWPLVKDGAQYLVFESGGVQVDIWFGTPANFGTLWMCRTGSKDHNIWLASGAAKRGGHWHPHDGLTLGGKLIAAEEKEIYAALGLQYLFPEAREKNLPIIRP